MIDLRQVNINNSPEANVKLISVEQNIYTNKTTINIGDDESILASGKFADNIKMTTGGENFDIAISLPSDNITKTIYLYLQPLQEYDIILSKSFSSDLQPVFWIVSYDASGNYTILSQNLNSNLKTHITVPYDSVIVYVNLRSRDAISLNMSVRKDVFAYCGDDAIKEIYISPSLASYNDFTYIFLARAKKVYESKNVWYNGLFYSLNGNIGEIVNEYTSLEEALNACKGTKIYSNNDNSFICVIDWSKTSDGNSNRFLSLMPDFNSLENKPTISSLFEIATINQKLDSLVTFDITDVVKEMYIAPSLALYSDFNYFYIGVGTKIYESKDKWYEGVYTFNNHLTILALNEYDNAQDAQSACEGVKIYSNDDKTFVAVIDWGKTTSERGHYISFTPIADYNNLANKPTINKYLEDTPVINGRDLWINRYPNLLDKLPVFSSKIYNHEDVDVVMLGDSFFAAQITCALNPDAANLPPQCARNHTQYQIWNRLCFNKPQYDRWDSQVNTFAETGTFSESGATWPTIWDTTNMTDKLQVKNTGTPLNRFSNDNNASIAFSWDMSAYEKLNFIYRKSNNINETDVTLGTSSALVTISEGNDKAQVFNGSAWVEANGYTFSMRITESGDGYAKTMPDVKLKFRKVTTDTINIAISNSANDGLLYYWGTERWNGSSLFITNIARGGFNTYWLNQNIINDLGERDCDLLIYEIPLTNDSYSPLSTIINRNIHIIEGGGESWLNTANFKALSNNFTKFDLLCIVPHIGTRYIDINSNTFKQKNGETSITYKQYFDAMRGLMETLEVPYIPLYKDWLDTSRNDYNNYYEAGVDRQSDDVHPNDKGCAIYASVIEPAIEI